MAFKFLVTFFLSAFSVIYAGSSPYVGVVLESGYDYLKQDPSGATNEQINPINYGLKMNLGIDGGDDIRTNFIFGVNYYDKDFYAYKTPEGTGSSNQLLYTVGIEVVKAYTERGSIVIPYWKTGMNYEFMTLHGYAQDWASNVALGVGVGTFLRMSEMLEWQLGLAYKYRMWGNYNLNTPSTQNIELSDHQLNLELGLNFHY